VDRLKVRISFPTFSGVARSICERITSVFEMIPTRLPASSTTGSFWMPDRRMTRAASLTSMSGWATMSSWLITLKIGSWGSASSMSRAVMNPSTRRPSQTGNPLCSLLSAMRRDTSSTLSSGVTVATSRVM